MKPLIQIFIFLLFIFLFGCTQKPLSKNSNEKIQAVLTDIILAMQYNETKNQEIKNKDSLYKVQLSIVLKKHKINPQEFEKTYTKMLENADSCLAMYTRIKANSLHNF